MGLLDIFKKKSNQRIETSNDNSNQIKTAMDIADFTILDNGKLQVEFCDVNKSFAQFYDTTRLIITRNPINLANREVYDCKVSWYGQDDCQFLNPKKGMQKTRAEEYSQVLAELDLNLLQLDPEYCRIVMQELLDRNRVIEKYLNQGLEDNPQKPCGQYIGGIEKTQDGYRKVFSMEAGKASHNSQLMVDRRRKKKEKEEAKKQREMENIDEQIAELKRRKEALERE